MKRISHIPINFVKRYRILSVIILIIVLIMGFVFRPKAPEAPEVKKVVRENFLKSISITGQVLSQKSINLYFPNVGKVVYIGAVEGDIVKKGQVIAALDMEKFHANLRQAEQDFNAAKAAVEEIYNSTGRKTNLSFDEKVSQTAAEATQNKAYDAMVKARKDITDANIISPIDGILTHSDVKSANVNVGIGAFFTVMDPESIEFRMEVDEADISQVAVGQKVRVNLDAYPDRTLHLTVDRIDFATHTTSTGGNAYNVIAKMPENIETTYRSGMGGDAEITTSEKSNVLTVPISSIFDDKYVYVKKGNKFEKRIVKFGIQNDTDAQVLSGISEGEIVAVDWSSIDTQK